MNKQAQPRGYRLPIKDPHKAQQSVFARLRLSILNKLNAST
jgi:hypothetical protein